MAKKQLGAATDDPKALISRAIREYDQATLHKKVDNVGTRQAAETGWLALSSLADVAAERMGVAAPSGALSRRKVLRKLEKVGKLSGGDLVHGFETARTTLHGACFHADECPIDVRDTLETLKVTVNRGVAAINTIKRKR